jgi:hypothetical protein
MTYLIIDSCSLFIAIAFITIWIILYRKYKYLIVAAAVILLCKATDQDFIRIDNSTESSTIKHTESFTDEPEKTPVFDEIKNESIKYKPMTDMRSQLYTDMDDKNAFTLAKQLGLRDKIAMDSRSRLTTNSFDNWKFYKKELDEDYNNGRRPWWNNDESDDINAQYISPSS